MADSDPPDPRNQHTERGFERKVGRKAKRRLRAERERNHNAWFWLGMFGLVGWSVAIPTLIGVAMGLWIDETWPTDVSWTLNLLIVGVIVGCLNAWYWIKQESSKR